MTASWKFKKDSVRVNEKLEAVLVGDAVDLDIDLQATQAKA